MSNEVVATPQSTSADHMRHTYADIWIGQLWDHGNTDGGRCLAETFTDHRPIEQFPNSKQGHIDMAVDWNLAFPDMIFTVEDMIVEGDQLVARYTARGTHEGPLLDIPGTGVQVELTGIDIMRFKDGLITDWWHNEDMQGLMEAIQRART
ncbi:MULTISPECIES: ester cyclase [Mycolicibacter]|uniref:Ester cyclase n=2 Tax=Mycolicibacter TaxID=1073531 RepID=A0ABU5XLX3_9MYCO|nr:MULTISPECIES: ester cyclase [unclassified Mycolicibacter]MEB3022994.1 ester cyclase [Mycolicibacter sp. MYC098]MEB3033504.1 ester cyclase [Mycolicibacter sp. MYC340]